MSGGSGSRVNAYTLGYIRQQQELAVASSAIDGAGMQSDELAVESSDEQDDMQYEEQGEIDPFHQLDSLEQEEHPVLHAVQVSSVPSIDDRDDDDYEKMAEGSIINTKIFDVSTSAGISYLKYHNETHRVLETAFSPGFASDLTQLLTSIQEKSNFEVREVVRLRNKKKKGMHAQFKRSYDIKQTPIVYHGTAHPDLISEVGFRGAACQRAKFGRGIYSSPNVFQAISYGQLTAEGHLTFLVVELHLGPIALGTPDQVLHTPRLYVLCLMS